MKQYTIIYQGRLQDANYYDIIDFVIQIDMYFPLHHDYFQFSHFIYKKNNYNNNIH